MKRRKRSTRRNRHRSHRRTRRNKGGSYARFVKKHKRLFKTLGFKGAVRKISSMWTRKK